MGVAGSCDQQHRLLACKAGNQIADDSCSICFPAPPASYIQSRSPAHGMAPLTFQLGLPFSVKPFRKHPHRHALECISLVTVNVDRLTRLTATKSLHKRLCRCQGDVALVRRTLLPLCPIWVKGPPLWSMGFIF